MKIKMTSVLVDDQDKALKFYTDVLGFAKKRDIPMGEHRFLTIISREQSEGPELLLEPMAFAPAKVYQKALLNAGIPAISLHVEDIENEYNRLSKLGVEFSMNPTQMGPSKLAVFKDTCGNNIQLVQVL